MSDDAIKITANGDAYTVDAGASVKDFVEQQELAMERVVVEYNGQPLPRAEAASTILQDGDTLEVVRIVAGG